MGTRSTRILAGLGLCALVLGAGVAAFAKGGPARPQGAKNRVPASKLVVFDATPVSSKTPPPSTRPPLAGARPIRWSRRLAQVRRLAIPLSPQAGDVYARLTAQRPYVKGRAGLNVGMPKVIGSWERAYSLSPPEGFNGHIELWAEVRRPNITAAPTGTSGSCGVYVKNTTPGRNFLVEFHGHSSQALILRASAREASERGSYTAEFDTERSGWSWIAIVLRCPSAGDYVVRVAPWWHEDGDMWTPNSVRVWTLSEVKITVL